MCRLHLRARPVTNEILPPVEDGHTLVRHCRDTDAYNQANSGYGRSGDGGFHWIFRRLMVPPSLPFVDVQHFVGHALLPEPPRVSRHLVGDGDEEDVETQ